MGRPWSAAIVALVYLGSSGAAKALPISISAAVTVSTLSDWRTIPTVRPTTSPWAIRGFSTTLSIRSAALVTASAADSVTLSVAPWAFDATFPGAHLAGGGHGGAFASLTITLTDGPIDTLRIRCRGGRLYHPLAAPIRPDRRRISASDILSPIQRLLGFGSTQFARASWRLDTQPGALATGSGGSAVPEPGATVLFGFGVALITGLGRQRHRKPTR